MKKLTTIYLCTLFLLFCFTIQVKASEQEVSDIEKEQLATLLSIDSEDILSIEVVYDFCDEPSFLLVDIAPYGYAIVFREFNIISERSVSEGAVSPYDAIDGKKYYMGPMGYFFYNNDKYIDILTQAEFNSNDIPMIKRAITEIMDKLRDRQQTDNTDMTLINSMPAESFTASSDVLITHADVFNNIGFGDNNNDTCGPVAAQLLLSYYAVVENKDYVPASWLHYDTSSNFKYDSKSELLHKDMQKRMKTTFGGTVPWTVADGINSYLKASTLRRSLMVTADWHCPTTSNNIKQTILSDNPCIIFTCLYAYPGFKYDRHVMVAYGFKNTFLPTFIVHTGWWDSNYIKPTLDIEIEGLWIVGSVTLEHGPSKNLETGKSVSLKSYVNLSKKASENEWTSSDPSIATVTNTGSVKAISAGQVTIKHNNKESNQITKFQFECYVPVKTLKIIKPDNDTLNNLTVNVDGSGGKIISLQIIYSPAKVTYPTFHWVSSNNDIISVDEYGIVTVKAAGKAKITVSDTTGKKKHTITLTVKYNPDSIQLKETEKFMLKGSKYTPTVILTPKKNLDLNAKKSLVWVSSNTAVATVDEKGKITAVSNGEAVISVKTKSGLQTSIKVNVVVPPTSLSIKALTDTEKILTIDENGSNASKLQLEKIFAPDNATDNFIWTSSNPKVISVTNNGFITALKNGTATIKVTDGLKKKSASIFLTVYHNPSGITFKETSKTIKVALRFTPVFTIEPQKTVYPKAKNELTWSSSNSNIAKVDENGKILGISEGTATITVKTKNGKTATIQITVIK